RDLGRIDVAGELDLAFLRIKRDQQHVVERQQRPDQQRDPEQYRTGLGQPAPPLAMPARQPRGGCRRDAHNATSLVWSRRISMITSGISSGNTDTAAAMPRSCLTESKV